MSPEMTVPQSESSGFFILFPPLGNCDRDLPGAILAKYRLSRQRRARYCTKKCCEFPTVRSPIRRQIPASGRLRASLWAGIRYTERMRCLFSILSALLLTGIVVTAQAATGLTAEHGGLGLRQPAAAVDSAVIRIARGE